MAKLEQPVIGHGPMATRRGIVQADTLWLQIIGPQQPPVQRPFKRGPVGIDSQRLQDPSQTIITHVQEMDRLPGIAAQGVEALPGPGGYMILPMVRVRPNVGQLDHVHPAQAEAHPVAMGGEVLVQQRLEPHPLQMG
jgi:hypothetical protein